jgi:DNA-binding HxlR family transcriptional regulator
MDETEEWIEFLKGKGTLHIVTELGESPKRFIDLEEQIPISTSTLDNRLKEGIRLDAWELTRTVDKEGDRKVYRLTSSGRNVYRGLEHNGGVEASHKARKHLATLEEAKRQFVERLREEE